jgi:leucyl aminopeptidase (aminopeptidase T)
MKFEEQVKMFNDVFAPRKGEKVLFLVDVPHDDIIDNETWVDRRLMAGEWFQVFKKMGEDKGFFVEILEFDATGMHNHPIQKNVVDVLSDYDLVIAMTEFSATVSLVPVCTKTGSHTRGASMPIVERRMEKTAFKADYQMVKKYAINITKILEDSFGAEVVFSTGDKLYVDLRNRIPLADTGDCTKPGMFINFPSGEGCKSPYEGIGDEVKRFGDSQTKGFMPVNFDGELVKFEVKNNKIIDVIGAGDKTEEMRVFFNDNSSRRNIAELGIGCNPCAVVTGNILEDEKVGGLHIAYGTSSHIGGKVSSDMHQDIVYAKGCPVEATTLSLIKKDGTKTRLIENAKLRYELIE